MRFANKLPYLKKCWGCNIILTAVLLTKILILMILTNEASEESHLLYDRSKCYILPASGHKKVHNSTVVHPIYGAILDCIVLLT